jgi:hypothetical protein
MNESGKNIWQIKKAYEIAYAAFRIAAKMGEQHFAGHLKSAAIGLLGAVAEDDYIGAKKRLVSLEYLIRFAMDVNIMGMTNGEIMLREIGVLNEGLTVEAKTGDNIDDEADIAGIFSEVDSVMDVADDGIRQNQIRQNDGGVPANHISGNDMQSGKSSESGNGEINVILKSAIRQSAILERIRQIGNCRMKDIQETLPDSSERTIRYDLQAMVEQNLIERVGSGGPAVFYRVKPGSV